MELKAFQELMELTYGERDRARGTPATIAWLAEEVGELARATQGTQEQQLHELGDVLAWTADARESIGPPRLKPPSLAIRAAVRGVVKSRACAGAL